MCNFDTKSSASVDKWKFLFSSTKNTKIQATVIVLDRYYLATFIHKLAQTRNAMMVDKEKKLGTFYCYSTSHMCLICFFFVCLVCMFFSFLVERYCFSSIGQFISIDICSAGTDAINCIHNNRQYRNFPTPTMCSSLFHRKQQNGFCRKWGWTVESVRNVVVLLRRRGHFFLSFITCESLQIVIFIAVSLPHIFNSIR